MEKSYIQYLAIYGSQLLQGPEQGMLKKKQNQKPKPKNKQTKKPNNEIALAKLGAKWNEYCDKGKTRH